MKNKRTIKNGTALTLVFVLLSLKLCSQAIPQLDTLTLMNGLKVYLLQYGEGTVLNARLVINGGKKNETACQVGYSEVIQQLLSETLKEKQELIFKKRNRLTCEIRNGQTIISGSCPGTDFNKQMQLLGTTITRLPFKHDKIHRSVAAIMDSYALENISASRLSTIYKDFILYGTKHPLGRQYCQYQLQKMLPGELRQFYFRHYLPKSAALLICGNFNAGEVKRIITKQFGEWRPAHQKENGKDGIDLKAPKIRSREIVFINHSEAKHCLLKWVQAAPSSKSSEHSAFLVACELFDRYLVAKIKEGNYDSLNFKPIAYTTDLLEMNCDASQNEMTKAIQLFDTVLQTFNASKFTKTELQEAVRHLKEQYLDCNTPITVLSFYDPLLYNFDARKYYLNSLSGITVADLELISKKYFNPNSYKLIIVGNEQAASGQLKVLENVTHYRALDFEACDAACVVHSKKKWKKGKAQCCFKCFLKGWCPCMYSPARLQ